MTEKAGAWVDSRQGGWAGTTHFPQVHMQKLKFALGGLQLNTRRFQVLSKLMLRVLQPRKKLAEGRSRNLCQIDASLVTDWA